MNYLAFILSNPRFLAYGFLMLFFSSFGQTYFFGPFTNSIRLDMGLSHGEIGLLFSISTGIAGVLMMWVGRKIDDVDLRFFTAVICAGLIAGCFAMSAATNIVTLLFAFFLLRLSGQGLMMHASFTTMARYFDKERGKAVSVAGFGMAAAQAVFPGIARIMDAELGWRDAWQYSAILLTIVLIPLMMWLLTGHGERHEKFLEENEEGQAAGTAKSDAWVRRVLLKDIRFYLIFPAFMSMPYLLTGFIFHQQFLADAKGWSYDLQPAAFTAFAGIGFICSVFGGPLVDRFGARNLIPFNSIPLILGIAVLAMTDDPIAAWLYLGLAGVSLGFAIPIGGAFWAEMYGPAHVGSARAIMGACGMIATALAPYTMGLLFDVGISVDAIAIWGVAYMIVALALVWLMVFRYWVQPGVTPGVPERALND
ncbi:MAG: MFS transporter [Alphaproteobacteria bacterium]